MENRLIVALDLTDGSKALSLARSLASYVFAVKVNWPLILGSGSSIISEMSGFVKVICDFKVADIPNTVRLIVEKTRDLGAYATIVHAFPGGDSLETAVQSAGGMKIIGVVAMSHPGASQFVNPRRSDLLDIAKKAGVYGIIAPGNDPNLLGELRAESSGLKIFAPGVGVQGGSPVEAVRAGADYIIVGRSIYESESPVDEARKINDQVSSVSAPQ